MTAPVLPEVVNHVLTAIDKDLSAVREYIINKERRQMLYAASSDLYYLSHRFECEMKMMI